ncbi:MAG: nucleotide sugar dehydrogenase [Gemmatimonadota bacterium]
MTATDATSADALRARFVEGTARCAVVGLGYVGLPLAVAMARAGFEVVGLDVTQAVADGVNNGRSHVKDVTSAEVAALVSAGSLRATTDAGELVDCDAIIICVPTPLSKTRDPDVSYVVAATEAVGATLRAGQLVILESTTYPGTTRELMLPVLESGELRVGRDFFLCFSPERVDPGNERWGIQNTPKVLGGITPTCLDMGMALYGRVMETVVPVSSTEAAELAKLLENTFRSINIALVNEMAQVADRLGVDIFEVIDAAASKPFGFMKFVPGPGIGGHCIPLDPHYLAWKMKTLNYRTRMVELAGEINSEMPRFVLEKVRDALNERSRALKGSRVLVLGVAYKPNIDDVRESPALDIIRLLEEKGADVRYHDPHVPEVREDGLVRRSVPYSAAELEAADCVLITTDHAGVDYALLAELSCPVVDTRNATRDVKGANIIGLSGRGQRAHDMPAAEADRTAEAVAH